MLARPTLCGGGVGPGLQGDFATSCHLPDGSGVPVRPCRVSDKDSASRDGTVSEVDGGGRGGQMGWFRRDGLTLVYFGCMAQRRSRWEGQAVATPHFV